jgi:hypothetical protein
MDDDSDLGLLHSVDKSDVTGASEQLAACNFRVDPARQHYPLYSLTPSSIWEALLLLPF